MGRIRFGRGPLSSKILPLGGLRGYGRAQRKKRSCDILHSFHTKLHLYDCDKSGAENIKSLC